MQPNTPMQASMPAQTDVSQGPEASEGADRCVDKLIVKRYADGSYAVKRELESSINGEGETMSDAVPAGGGEAGEGDETGERLESLELALKAIVQLDKAHPLGETAQDQFAGGFKSSASSAGLGANAGAGY